ncbi:putative transposase [Cucumis melo var. makuwa]|uniref:Putative transposase n=1 Tax=Cucumis melo var. makuwa TaxID=1194695 RepID=A0A5D3BTF8_CUCMM|nr:putative transposase [Cucumis melo var. makuwa]
MVITAHFIDDDWNLHKRILNFCQVANHKGDTIGRAIEKCLCRAIEKCLEGWGIDRLFTVTVGNARSNDVAIAYLVKKFKVRNGLVLDGEFIHIRCCARILNLIVSDALKDLHVFIIRIRNVVNGSYKARAAVHDRFKQSNKTCLDDAKTEVARYLDEARIDSISDEYLDLLTWWKVNSSRFKIISQVARDIYSIPISTVPSESAFSTGGRSKPLDKMTEEIDGAEEIDEEFINIGRRWKPHLRI